MYENELTEYEKYIKSLEEDLLEELRNSYSSDNKKESESRNEEEKEKVYLRERKIIKVPVYVTNTGKDKKGIPIQMTALLLGTAVLAGASFYQKKGNDIKFPFISNLLNQKQDGQNKNGTGNINDRVYLSEDMTKVTIHYKDKNQETQQKDYKFSENAKNYYKQIINNNKFYSRNAQAAVICALMTLDRGMYYKWNYDPWGMNIGNYECSHYIDEVAYLATGDNLGFGDTSTIRRKGKEISRELCQPGDIKQKTKTSDGKSNHVVMYLGKLDDGKEYMIDCSRRGVTVRPDTNYPVCIRLDRLNTDEILMSKNNGEEIGLYSFDTNQFLISKNNGEEIGLYSFDTNQFLISKNDRGEER